MKPNLLTKMPNLPPLDAVVDKVLAHKPKPKSSPARKRARRAKKIAKESA